MAEITAFSSGEPSWLKSCSSEFEAFSPVERLWLVGDTAFSPGAVRDAPKGDEAPVFCVPGTLGDLTFGPARARGEGGPAISEGAKGGRSGGRGGTESRSRRGKPPETDVTTQDMADKAKKP